MERFFGYLLGYLTLCGLVMCLGTLFFVESGMRPLFGDSLPTYEAAIAYGVMGIASGILLLVFLKLKELDILSNNAGKK